MLRLAQAIKELADLKKEGESYKVRKPGSTKKIEPPPKITQAQIDEIKNP